MGSAHPEHSGVVFMSYTVQGTRRNVNVSFVTRRQCDGRHVLSLITTKCDLRHRPSTNVTVVTVGWWL